MDAQIPYDVLAVYAAVVIWAVVAINGVRKGAHTATLWFGIVLLLFLNLRYVVEGIPSSIAFFVGIYDIADNLGLAAGETAPALAACPGNACSVWGDTYTLHPSWGVAFYDRFANGPEFRSTLLYGHLIFNSIVFVLMHVQLAMPGTDQYRARHRLLGRVAFSCLTLGVACAVWLASEHGPVGEYGGEWAKYGFWSMSLCVYGCALMGVVNIRRGDAQAHRIWMIRFAGSMWGAFWLFRLMLLVLGPLLRESEAAALLICIWFSAPLGVVLAEVIRRALATRQSVPAAAI